MDGGDGPGPGPVIRRRRRRSTVAPGRAFQMRLIAWYTCTVSKATMFPLHVHQSFRRPVEPTRSRRPEAVPIRAPVDRAPAGPCQRRRVRRLGRVGASYLAWPVVHGLARLITGVSLMLLNALMWVLPVEEFGRYAAGARSQGLAVATLRLGLTVPDRTGFVAARSFAVLRRRPVALTAAAVVLAWWPGFPSSLAQPALALGQGWFKVAGALPAAAPAPTCWWVLGASRNLLCVAGASGLGALWGEALSCSPEPA